jgi:hypothetical protein
MRSFAKGLVLAAWMLTLAAPAMAQSTASIDLKQGWNDATRQEQL